jgi:salicylate hydroxylase
VVWFKTSLAKLGKFHSQANIPSLPAYPDIMINGEQQVILNIGIVGAGIAGLAAAIALRKVSHNVTVYERSSFKMEVGAAINMPPQATRIMRDWGLPIPSTTDHISGKSEADGETNNNFGGTILGGTQRINFKTAQALPGQRFAEIATRYDAPFISYHRGDLHTLLRTHAERLGAKIVLGSPATDIDCQNGRLTVSPTDKAQDTIQYDVLVIADGINTSFVPHIVGKDIPLDRLGRMCFRTLIPTSKILSHESAKALYPLEDGIAAGVDGVSGSMNPQASVMLIQYPCREGDLMNVAIFDRPKGDNVEKQDWNSPATIEDALEPLADFHEAFKGLIECADSMKAFAIAIRDPLPTYANGRVVLIGDAAHPMLPSLAGGGSTSMEDAATLSILLSDVPNADIGVVSSRLKLFSAIRVPRDATQQVISNSMFKPQPASMLKDKISPFYDGNLPNKVLGGWTKETCEFVCGYDVVGETQKAKSWAEEQGWKDIGTLPPDLIQHFGEISR